MGAPWRDARWPFAPVNWRHVSGRRGWIALVALIVLYGALLRVAAITDIYGPVERPQWLGAVQGTVAASPYLRPQALRSQPTELFPHRDGPPTQYRSDPYTYLRYAREMDNFYAAHRREPLFPAATKVFLVLLADQDVAVSFTSAAFSTLAIGLTFWLGAFAFRYAVGAGAALLVAIENDLIVWGAGGWRDDAFMCGVLATAIAVLRFWRTPDRRSAVLLGVVAGLACLVRITSLSFIVPSVAVVLLLPGQRRPRLIGAAIALGVATLLVGPYLVNCWRVYGDPFHAINVHATVYQETEGGPEDSSLTAGQYLRGHLAVQPVRTIDTVAEGLTVYPFANKWHGFHPWWPGAVRWLSWAAIVGLLLFAASPAGRLLLVVLVSSLVPYAATWKLIADWRFTAHAYPFFLIAAALAVASLVSGLLALRQPRRLWPPADRAGLAWLAAAVVSAALAAHVMTRVLPVHTMREALQAGAPVMLTALDRDAAFFPRGWRRGPPGGLPTRVIDGWRAAVDLPLPPGTSYEIVLRVDPSLEPVGPDEDVVTVQLFLNGRLLARCDPGSTPERIGVCRMRVPADLVRPGMDRLLLATEPDQASGFRVWHLHLQPVTPASP
jgi:hypothetical protein